MKTGLRQWLLAIVFALILTSAQDIVANRGHGGGGWHGGGWHGGGWHGGGWHRRGGVYIGVGVYQGYYPYYYNNYPAQCVVIRGHYNYYGYWVPTHTQC